MSESVVSQAPTIFVNMYIVSGVWKAFVTLYQCFPKIKADQFARFNLLYNASKYLEEIFLLIFGQQPS